jgi:hypothetical protein
MLRDMDIYEDWAAIRRVSGRVDIDLSQIKNTCLKSFLFRLKELYQGGNLKVRKQEILACFPISFSPSLSTFYLQVIQETKEVEMTCSKYCVC